MKESGVGKWSGFFKLGWSVLKCVALFHAERLLLKRSELKAVSDEKVLKNPSWFVFFSPLQRETERLKWKHQRYCLWHTWINWGWWGSGSVQVLQHFALDFSVILTQRPHHFSHSFSDLIKNVLFFSLLLELPLAPMYVLIQNKQDV